MASGYGLRGGPSRCFAFWQELLSCYVVNSSEGEEGKKKCVEPLEDYMECLHHKKEMARVKAMQHAYRRALSAHPRDNAPRAEQISSLGLLGKEEDTKTVMADR